MASRLAWADRKKVRRTFLPLKLSSVYSWPEMKSWSANAGALCIAPSTPNTRVDIATLRSPRELRGQLQWVRGSLAPGPRRPEGREGNPQPARTGRLELFVGYADGLFYE
eukprot:scaffold140930_cov35-Tisochrysis_lutea.AAC.2